LRLDTSQKVSSMDAKFISTTHNPPLRLPYYCYSHYYTLYTYFNNNIDFEISVGAFEYIFLFEHGQYIINIIYINISNVLLILLYFILID